MTKKSRALRRALIVVGVLVLGLIGFVASVVVSFMAYAPVKNGTMLPGGAELVTDGTSNVYILPDGTSKVVLVDCGIDPKMDAVRAALQKRNLTLDSVEAVLITHGHTDHIGGCPAVPKATLYAQTREVAAIEGKKIIPGFVSTVSFARPKPNGWKVTGLADDQNLQIGSLSIRAYALPGHTPGSGAYLVNNVLYIGDAAGITPDGKTAPAPWIFNTNGSQADATLKALAERLRTNGSTVGTVATGHSAPGPFTALTDMR